MLSLTSCPKCQHVFPLGACAGAAASCRARLALSGGGLLRGCPCPEARKPPPAEPYRDLARLQRAVRHLRLSGWYYEDLNMQASQERLKHCAPGTFLVRDSGDSNFLYSLSVQTARGPTSVRLHYAEGLFRLDAEPGVAMPQFACVVQLVEHYVEQTRARGAGRAGRAGHVWVDAAGSQFSFVEVRRPLLRAPASLAHSARLAVQRALRAAAPPSLPLLPPTRALGLPGRLEQFLAEYPYTC